MREFFTIAIFKIKADIRMNKTTLNSQKEKHSMLSLRRATGAYHGARQSRPHFYPRSPCGERRNFKVYNVPCIIISIHALLAESDGARECARGPPRAISIHALLAESDTGILPHYSGKIIFLSTLSLRRATFLCFAALKGQAFLSTLSLRRATSKRFNRNITNGYFYPRSPCGERRLYRLSLISVRHFYPRSPCGERLIYRRGI